MYFSFILAWIGLASALPSIRTSIAPTLTWSTSTINGTEWCREQYTQGGNDAFTLDALCPGPCPAPLPNAPLGSIQDLHCGFTQFPKDLTHAKTKMMFMQIPDDTCRWQFQACVDKDSSTGRFTKYGPFAFQHHTHQDCNWDALQKLSTFTFTSQAQEKAGTLSPATMQDILYAEGTLSPTVPPPQSTTTESTTLSAAAIVGIVLGCLIATSGIIAAVFWHRKHAKHVAKTIEPIQSNQPASEIQIVESKVAL
jgi:hypothetical protein